jgi:hypothetical protein
LRFRIQGLRFEVWDVGFRLQGQGPGFRVQGLGFRLYCWGFRFQGVGLMVQG